VFTLLTLDADRGNLVETGSMAGMRRLMFVGLASLVVTACAHDGRTLQPAPPGATAPTTVPATSTTTGQALVLTSSAFAPSAPMPVELSCDGTNVSPSLQWTGVVPATTAEMALTVTDPDAGGFVHWVVTDLAPVLRGIGPGAVPEGAVEAMNGKGELGWTGPCPPQGPAHHYVFTLYALAAPSGVTSGMSATEAIVQITSAPVLATATLTGTYQRRA
jgi:Raf kinase inhibitor-like YbhB/YbcL family protein